MVDLIDHATELVAKQTERALARHHSGAQRRELVSALPPGTPRECEDCGDQVPAQRLAALPMTARCVACQALAERSR